MSSDAVVNLVVNAADAETQVNVQLRRIVNDAERRAPDITLHVNVDNTGVIRSIDEQSDRLAGHLDEVNANLLDIADTLRRIDSSGGLRRIGDDTDDADRSTHRLSGTFTALAGGIGRAVAASSRLVLVGGVASQAIPVVGALVTSIESLVPAATAGVSAFVTMKAAALTLKVGLTGVEDAIAAVFDPDADPEKVAEALDKLSKNARSFVVELQTLKPAFDRLRLDIQDRLFKGLDSQLSATAKATLPTLRRAAQDFADTFNGMAKGVASGARDVGENGTLGKALSQGTTAFSKLERIPGQVLVAVTQLAAAGGPLLNRFVDRVVSLADTASKALSGAFESGALQDAVDAAGDTLAQLGRIAGNVFGALGNIFSVADTSGSGLFGTLEKVTQALEDLTGTDEFKDTLGALIDVGSTLADAVLPLLEEAFLAIAPAIQILAPYVSDLVELLGDKLAELIPELAPVLAELATLFGEILVAITPLIEQGINVLIEIMPSLIPLLESLVELVAAVAPLIEDFAVGAAALLVPAIEATIEILSALVDATTLVVGAFDAVIQWIAKFALSLTNQADPGVRAFTQLMNGDFKGALDTSAVAIRDLTLKGVGYIVDFAARSASAILGMISSGVRYITSGFNQMTAWIARKTAEAIGYVTTMRDRIIGLVLGLANGMFRYGQEMIASLTRGILSQLGNAVSAASKVVSGIRDYFPHSPAKKGAFSGRGYPYYSGQEVLNSFTRGIVSRSPAAQKAVEVAMRAIAAAQNPASNPLAGIVPGGSEFAGIANTTFARLTPNVTVNIGNRALTDYVQVVIDEDTLQRDRLAAQGARS